MRSASAGAVATSIAVIQRLRSRLRQVVARSWLLSRAWYRLHGMRLDGRPSDLVWYFAYGANMSDSVFRERRGMRPLQARAGRIPGYRLRFNLDGRPLGKAAPANICDDPASEVWGVLYSITRRDLLRLDASERIPGRRYRHLHADAEDKDGRCIRAVTYMARGNEHDGSPSLRYLTLLRDGARAYELPPHWVELLAAIKHAE